jgi:hypothetical protein
MQEYESIKKKRSPLILGIDPPKNSTITKLCLALNNFKLILS